MNKKLINIFTNDMPASMDAMAHIRDKFNEFGYTVTTEYSPDASLIICIGGDGAFIRSVHKCDFPDVPFLGVNTGHLGFFEEISLDEFDSFLMDYFHKRYTIQTLNTVNATVITQDGGEYHHTGLNEIVIRGRQSSTVHLGLCIDDILIQQFTGDGILCAPSSGSTAYNYSLGGAIVDPRLDSLQLTPIAPINTNAYRSFTSSLMLPSEKTIEVVPSERQKYIFLFNDGYETGYTDVVRINIKVSDTTIKLIRRHDYDFWSKVKSKFL